MGDHDPYTLTDEEQWILAGYRTEEDHALWRRLWEETLPQGPAPGPDPRTTVHT